MSFAELLTSEQVERVHEASLEILQEVGLLVRFAPARELFRNHGGEVDSETNRVKFPRAIVEKYIKVLPPKFTFHGRDPKYDRTFPHMTCFLSQSWQTMRRIINLLLPVCTRR